MKTDDQQVLKAIIVDDEDLARKGLAMRLKELITSSLFKRRVMRMRR